MSSSRVGGGGCVPKYDSAENRDPSESGAVMMEQRAGSNVEPERLKATVIRWSSQNR